MARNTGDTRFRKLNVDDITQITFDEEAVDDTHLNRQDVERLLSSGQYEEAVRMVLDNAPVNSKDVGLKEAASALILRGMSSIRTNQIDAFVGGLNQKQLDTLMKYIYRGFQKPVDITCPALLTWHEKDSVGTALQFHTVNKRINLKDVDSGMRQQRNSGTGRYDVVVDLGDTSRSTCQLSTQNLSSPRVKQAGTETVFRIYCHR